MPFLWTAYTSHIYGDKHTKEKKKRSKRQVKVLLWQFLKFSILFLPFCSFFLVFEIFLFIHSLKSSQWGRMNISNEVFSLLIIWEKIGYTKNLDKISMLISFQLFCTQFVQTKFCRNQTFLTSSQNSWNFSTFCANTSQSNIFFPCLYSYD